ncbi:MAG TPA: hypothetical protein VN281_18500 [Verrucomicrobiae bacterium]|nr:hypothetical protein [Verrucomicrobiae bacterium]
MLLAMISWFLAISWRKWTDPLIDVGPQLYATWQVSQGALPYHDFVWNYGPFSLFLNATLFKVFGPGMLVLATANLIIYALIVALAYMAFRTAWGRLGAFAALAVFIGVFSFSHLTSVGNYNFVTPYSNESTHGMLVALVVAFLAARWSRGPSCAAAFWLGFCGGLTAVLKPEFMLAGAVIGVTAVGLRLLQRLPVRLAELGLVLAGLLLPTLAFTIWFARIESFRAAFVDASQAWWLVLVEHVQRTVMKQEGFTGFDSAWPNLARDLRVTATTLFVLTGIWAAGWIINRSRPWPFRIAIAIGELIAVSFARLEAGWFDSGRCLPVILAIVFGLVVWRLWHCLREGRQIEPRTVMSLTLVLLSIAMLVRLGLRVRVYHLGFFQAAFAGMVAAAAMITELPLWTGPGLWGRRLAAAGYATVLIIGCGSIAAKSLGILAQQTMRVGTGSDLFYVFNGSVDETAKGVNFAVNFLRGKPPKATLVVFPEGAMINYLVRRVNPLPAVRRDATEEMILEQLRQAHPDYVVMISRDPREYGPNLFGKPGNSGQAIVAWLGDNYETVIAGGGNPLDRDHDKAGVTILRSRQK